MVAQVNTPAIAWLIYKNCITGQLCTGIYTYLMETNREQPLKWVSLLNLQDDGTCLTYLKG